MAESREASTPTRRPDNRQILTAIAVCLLVWFAVSNWQSVTIHFWLTTAKAPLFLVIVLSAVLGGVVIRFARRRGGATKR
jgi:uncharacterized integral membrane protein